MANAANLAVLTLRRDHMRCQACGTTARQVLAVHHVIPVALGGRDALSNLTTLCANCHRTVHWLAAGDRSLEAHGYGVGQSAAIRRRLLELARHIRRRRLSVIGPDLVLRTAVPLDSAIDAVVTRNGFDHSEGRQLRRCLRRALRAMALSDRRDCSVRLVRGARFISVNANNHLVIRVPAYSDAGYRIEGDMLVIWPQAVRPSILSSSEFRRASSVRFKLIPHFNLSLTWNDCLSLTSDDWRVFRRACHDALTLARTRRWTSNVVVESAGA